MVIAWANNWTSLLGHRLESMVKVLNEDILPALEKLRKDKDQYYRWQTVTADLDVLRRFCIAYKYAEAKR